MASTDTLKRKVEEMQSSGIEAGSAPTSGKAWLAQNIVAMQQALRDACYYRAMIVRFQMDLQQRNLAHIQPRPPAHLLKGFARACFAYRECRLQMESYVKRAAVAHAEVKTRPIAASAGNTTNDLDLHPVMIKKEPPESSKERPVANLATVVDGESGQPANAAVGASAVVKPANHDDVIDIDALPTPAGLEGAGKIIDLDAPEVRADGGAPNTAHAMKDGKPASEGPQQKGIDMTASLEQGQGSDVVPGADGDGFDPSQFMAGFDPSILGASDSGLNSAMLDPQDAGPGLGVPSFDGTASWTMPAPIQAPGDPPGPSAAQGDPALASAADAQGGSTMPPDFAGMDMDQFAELMKTLPADADPAAGVGAGDGVEAGTGDMGDLPGFDASAMLGMGQVDWEGIDLDSMLGSYFQADGGEGGAQ